MREFLYFIIDIITGVHNYVMSWNDTVEYNFTDKELHFLVIGILGMAMVFVVHAVVLWLAKNNHLMTFTFIYVFTVMVVITFAIEIGQKISKTGKMEFADIMYGLVGFLAMFAVFSILRMLYHGILRLIRYWQASRSTGKYLPKEEEETEEY